MDDAFFAENTLTEINIPEDPELNVEAALSAPEPDIEENVTSLIPSIPQRSLLYFGKRELNRYGLHLLLIARQQMKRYRYTSLSECLVRTRKVSVDE